MKDKKKLLILSLIIYLLTEVLLSIVVFLEPQWFRSEWQGLIGTAVTPVAVGVFSLLLFLIIKSYWKIRTRFIALGILLNMILTEIALIGILSYGDFYYYLGHLEDGRKSYENTIHAKLNSTKPEVEKMIYERFPKGWKIEEVSYDKNRELYWFSVLEPSFLYGSNRYVGIYRENQNSIYFISINDVWNQVVKKRELPSEEQYSYASNSPFEVSFMTSLSHRYTAVLDTYQGKLVINEVLP